MKNKKEIEQSKEVKQLVENDVIKNRIFEKYEHDSTYLNMIEKLVANFNLKYSANLEHIIYITYNTFYDGLNRYDKMETLLTQLLTLLEFN